MIVSFGDGLKAVLHVLYIAVCRNTEMSRAQGPQKPSFPFGNAFRMMLPKGSYISPELLALLNKFEEALAGRLRKLLPKENDSVCSLSWMILASKMLSETHNDIKSLINDLELPLANWDEKWIDVYLGNSVKLLDICIAFTSEISRLSQGQLLLQCMLHNLSQDSPKEFTKARSSLDNWLQHIGSRNPRIDNCCAIVDQLVQSIGSPKIKKSAKGKVLMQAMYGVRVLTILLCSVFISVFRGSNTVLIDLDVPQTHSWAEAYTNLESSVHKEVREFKPDSVLIKEVEAVEQSSKALLSLIQEADESAESKAIKDSISELERRTESLSGGLDLFAKEVDGFFQIVFSSRDALLCNLRTSFVTKGGLEEDRKKRVANEVSYSDPLLKSKFKV